MKYVIFYFFLFPLFSLSQDNPLYRKPPAGKARIIFLYDMYERWQRTIILAKAPVFVNNNLKCKIGDGTFTYLDVIPGYYFLAAEESGKRLRKHAPVTELEAEEGRIYYFELEGRQEVLKGFVYVQRRKPQELEEIIERKRTRFTEICNN
jgi:hypothetical protein